MAPYKTSTNPPLYLFLLFIKRYQTLAWWSGTILLEGADFMQT